MPSWIANFSYPYISDLKYSASTSDSSIVIPNVKKSDSLKLEINNLGICDISMTATDIYGNKKSTNFMFEVLVSPTKPTDTSGVLGISKANNIEPIIFTNPASSNIYIKLNGLGNTHVDIQLYSYTGQLIDRIYYGSSSTKIAYDSSYLHSGLYFIRLETDGGKTFIKKLVVQK